jgi:hypothetical protein
MPGNEATAEKSVGLQGELFDLKHNTSCYLSVELHAQYALMLRLKSKSS